MLNKIWNSKSFEMISEVNYEILKGIGFTLKTIGETFNQEQPRNTSTYEYWKALDYEGQRYYFESNEYLKDYPECYYPNDRELTAKHVQELADKLNREFTNINNRY